MPVTVLVATHCTLCGEYDRVAVPEEQYKEWKKGAYVQSAFPELSASQREQLISGTCGPCWEKYMRFDEEE
jgi:hypothetical protein